MKSIFSKSRLGGFALALFVLFGVGLVSNVSAQDQGSWERDRQQHRDRDQDNQDRRRRNRDSNRNNGDWNRDSRDRNRDNDDWNRNNGYGRNGQYGNGQYGNGQYGRNGGYGGYNIYRAAQNQGYQAGLNTGASDAQRGQSYDPQRSHYYRNATYGYNSSYGNREQYKQAYRDGFLRGYQEGYQRYGGYNRGRNNGIRLPW